MENKNTELHAQIRVCFHLRVFSCSSIDLRTALLENKLVSDDFLTSLHTQHIGMQSGWEEKELFYYCYPVEAKVSHSPSYEMQSSKERCVRAKQQGRRTGGDDRPYLGVSRSASALVGQLGHGRQHSQRQAHGQSEEQPAQGLRLQGTPALSALVKAAGFPPLVPQVVEVARFPQLEDGDGELLSPPGCWQQQNEREKSTGEIRAAVTSLSNRAGLPGAAVRQPLCKQRSSLSPGLVLGTNHSCPAHRGMIIFAE